MNKTILILLMQFIEQITMMILYQGYIFPKSHCEELYKKASALTDAIEEELK